MNSQRLFVASCLAIAATALAFSVRADIIPALKADFGLTDTEIGQIAGSGLWGFAITIVLGGVACSGHAVTSTCPSTSLPAAVGSGRNRE